MTDTTEIEILQARRAFPEAQRLLAGSPNGVLPLTTAAVGWHDVGASPEVGSFALANFGGPFESHVGEILRVTVDGASPVFVFLVGRADLTADLSLARRAFSAVRSLQVETVVASIESVS